MYLGCGRQSARRTSFAKYEPAPAEGPHIGELVQEFDKATPSLASGISSLICIARTRRRMRRTTGRSQLTGLSHRKQNRFVNRALQTAALSSHGRSRFSQQLGSLRARHYEVRLSAAPKTPHDWGSGALGAPCAQQDLQVYPNSVDLLDATL